MSRAGLQHRLGYVNSWLMVFMAFSLPLSSACASVFAVLFTLAWLIQGDYRRKMLEIVTNPVSRAVAIYVAVLALGMLWNDNLAESLHGVRKQWKILLMPVLLTAVRPKQRRLVIWAFIAGVSLMMLATYLAWLGLLEYDDVSRTQLTSGSFHVVYNPLLALACYLVLHQLIWSRLGKPWMRPALILLLVLMCVNMFMTDGRAGQLGFLALIGLLVFQYLCASRWKAVLALVLAPPIIFCATYTLSPTFKARVDLACKEVAMFRHNPQTSVGQRLFYWEQSLLIFGKRPILGVGTGGFAVNYARHNNMYTPYMLPTDNPHNQYILVLVQNGVPGLVAFLWIFVAQIRMALGSRDEWGRLRLALPVLFLVIMLTESYLLIHESGVLFSLFSAVLYKETERQVGGPV